jgi:hypothetical protein
MTIIGGCSAPPLRNSRAESVRCAWGVLARLLVAANLDPTIRERVA